MNPYIAWSVVSRTLWPIHRTSRIGTIAPTARDCLLTTMSEGRPEYPGRGFRHRRLAGMPTQDHVQVRRAAHTAFAGRPPRGSP